MDTHKNARLTPKGRDRKALGSPTLATRVCGQRWPGGQVVLLTRLSVGQEADPDNRSGAGLGLQPPQSDLL